MFIHSGARDDRLKEAVNTFHLHGRKVHLCTDCFSGGLGNGDREADICIETEYAFDNYKIDGICFDAIRYWQPLTYDKKGYSERDEEFDKNNINHVRLVKDWIKFFLGDWTKRCKVISASLTYMKYMLKGYTKNKIEISACLKCELPNYKWAKRFARLYGQDYKLMAPYVDFLLPMSYKYLYNGFFKDYHPVNLATEMQLDTGRPVIPLLQCYYNNKEYNSLGRMPTWKDIRDDMFLDNWCLYLYKDMKRGGLF